MEEGWTIVDLKGERWDVSRVGCRSCGFVFDTEDTEEEMVLTIKKRK